jgi:hypothetical protein
MKRTRAELKAALMRQAEAAIEQLLDFDEQTTEPTLTQIEDAVLKLREQISVQAAHRVATLPLKRSYYYCETCRRGLFPPGPTTSDLGEPLE